MAYLLCTNHTLQSHTPVVILMMSLNTDTSTYNVMTMHLAWADPEGGGQGSGPPLKNHKNIGFHSNTVPDSLKKSQSYQASIQCWATIAPPAKRYLMVFCWWADDGPLLVLFGSSLPSSAKRKKKVRVGLPPPPCMLGRSQMRLCLGAKYTL